MREPRPAVAVDAAILISILLGRSRGALLEAAGRRSLLTTGRVVEEVRRRLSLGMNRPELLEALDGLVAEMIVVPVDDVADTIDEAERSLLEAVASRNGSTRDAHVLALAWLADADIWTFDRDFAGTGVASWSTPNLMRALAVSTSR